MTSPEPATHELGQASPHIVPELEFGPEMHVARASRGRGSETGPAIRLARRSAAAPVLALALACSPPADDPPGLLREPRVLRFSPAHPEQTLHLSPRGGDPVTLARIRVDPTGPDWGAFTITDATLPRRLVPGEPAELHLRVDLGHFAGDRPHEHHSGAAALTLLADKQPVRVRLEFIPDPPPDLATWPRLLLLAALAALATARRWPWHAAIPALLFLAVAPVTSGVCLDLLGEPATAADLLQCGETRGGFAGPLIAHPDGLALALAAACLSGLALRSWRVLALALFAALVAAGTLDPRIAVQDQSGLRWGLWMQPFGAAALAVAALLHLRGDLPLPRLTTLGLAALLTTLLLGGPDLGLGPAPLGLPHAAVVAAGLVAWLGKLLVVAWALRRLAARPTRTPEWLARLVVPLAAAQILASTLSSRWP